MGKKSPKDSPIILLEPDINPITKRFVGPLVANYPPLAQVRLAGQIDDPHLWFRLFHFLGRPYPDQLACR